MSDESAQPKLSLAAKIAAIRSEVGTIEKTGYNEFNRYKYAEESAILAALNPLLSKYRITIIPSVLEKKSTPLDKGFFTEIKLRYVIYDLDSPDTITVDWCGDGADSQDKGLYKAYTGGNKYFLLKLFGVGTSDDPENDKAEHKEAQKAEKRKRQTSTSPEGHWMACPQCGELCVYRHTSDEFGEVFECTNPKCSKKGSRFKWVRSSTEG